MSDCECDIYDISDLSGEGIFDILKDAKRRAEGVYDAFTKTRDNYNPSSRKVLAKYGNMNVKKLDVCRKPINQNITALLKLYNKTLGRGTGMHDRFFHLFLVATLENGTKIGIEKNHVLNVEIFKDRANQKCMNVPYNGGLTIKQMLDKTEKKLGKKAFYEYDAINRNCQMFVNAILTTNDLNNNEIKSFVMQPVDNLLSPWAEKTARLLTDVASKADLIVEGRSLY
jgi:hypothetical protein